GLFGVRRRVDGPQQGRNAGLQGIGPLFHRRLPAGEDALVVQTDVGDLAVVDLHQAQTAGDVLDVGDAGLDVEGGGVVIVLALGRGTRCRRPAEPPAASD